MKRAYEINGTDIVYDQGAYLEYYQKVKNAMDQANNLPESVRNETINFLRQAVEGALGVAKEIYFPLVDEEKLKIVEASHSDYKTDLKGLEDLSK